MFDRLQYERDKELWISLLRENDSLRNIGLELVNQSNKLRYAYVWTWLGLPVIQMPEDLIKTQEVIFKVKPDIIIETGVAWGGSLLFYASILKSLGHGKVIGIDLTIPSHNREAIINSPCSEFIDLIEGSSIDNGTYERVLRLIPEDSKVMLILDSNHTHNHVIAELELWSNLVSRESYIVVCDTIVEFIDSPSDRIRPWGKGDNPLTALNKFLENNSRFTMENEMNDKSLISFHPFGFLKAIS